MFYYGVMTMIMKNISVPLMTSYSPADLYAYYLKNKIVSNEDTMKAMEFLFDVFDGKNPSHIPVVSDPVASAMSHAAMKAGFYARATDSFCKSMSQYLFDDAVVLDPMAGRGYLAQGLSAHGVNVIASDDYSWDQYRPEEIPDGVHYMDAMESLRTFASSITHLILAWAPPKITLDLDLAQEALKINPDITVINIGEVHGCTGSDDFWDHFEAVEVNNDNHAFMSYETTAHLYDFPCEVRVIP